MHYLEKWTIRISKYKGFFCGFLYLPSFIHLLLSQTTMFLLEMLWDSAAPATTFTLCSDSYTHFSKSRVRDSRTPLSGYFTMWPINFGCNLRKKGPWAVYHPKNSPHYGHLPPPRQLSHSFYGLPFTAQLLSSPSLGWEELEGIERMPTSL